MYICNSDAIIALIKLFIIYFHCELHHVVEETETHVFALLRMVTIQALFPTFNRNGNNNMNDKILCGKHVQVKF